MAKILITGSRGTIGSVLCASLRQNHDVIGLDLPECDVRNYDVLLDEMRGADTVIHATWSTDEAAMENPATGLIDPTNVLLEMNVFHAAVEAGVKRLIMASSVHTDNFLIHPTADQHSDNQGGRSHQRDDLLTVPGSYRAGSPYGAHKLITEEIGRFYSSHHGIEFIGVRFGGVTKDDSVRTYDKEPVVWLSHRDLTEAIKACVIADVVPNGFAVFYAVSNNTGRLHDTENPFGWSPIDNSQDRLA